ncbi:MAG: hypothetical protein EON60_01420 [Alphaproteobacteria bacterium]|nr:MAG: hypothetical protein EON60_01420 [Alphaproteobacteria bacterium]
MAGFLYALAVYMLGLWLAYKANVKGLEVAVQLMGARLDKSHHSRIVRWPDGDTPLYRVALLYAAGLLGTAGLLLVLAIMMGVGFVLKADGTYPGEALSMVATMWTTWLNRGLELAGMPYFPSYWTGDAVLLPLKRAMVEHAFSIDGFGEVIFILAYELGQVAALYLAISFTPLLWVTPVGRAVGQWMYGWGNDPFLYAYRVVCHRALQIGAVIVVLVEGFL